MATFKCSNCGGDVPEQLYRRTITCTYCSTSQPNPRCLSEGHELLVHGAEGLSLEHVATCSGPDAITVEGEETVYKLEDVIPVTVPTPELASGSAVYHRSATRWRYTFTASSAHDGLVKVKNDNAGFQDSFFDQAATLDDLRLDARPPELGGKRFRRSALGSFLAQVRDSPFDYGVKLFIAVIFVIVGVSVARAFL